VKPIRRAVIDVGTNSIKLLVADVLGSQVTPVCEQSKQTRLGSGFYENHRLQPDAIARAAQAVAKFASTAHEHQAPSIRVIATSAAREAVNASELTNAIKSASGLEVEIVSGEQEADWVFKGVISDPVLADGPLLLLDVGGGSAEFIAGSAREKLFGRSFPLGTVRLLERFLPSDPPTPHELSACQTWVHDFLLRHVEPQLAAALAAARQAAKTQAVRFVGTGGTATILARLEAKLDDYDRTKIESTRLSFDRVAWHLRQLWRLPLEERKKIIGLPKNRADVILMGTIIYAGVMEQFGFRELNISTRCLRFALLMG